MHFRTSKNATWIEKPKCPHQGGPVVGSFQHTLWPRERAKEHNQIFSELQYFGPDLRLARTKTAIPIRSLKNADCWLQTGYKMQTENLYCFFVWYVITCHLTTYRASRNRFSAIIFHDYLHYCGIFLARFLITVILSKISSLHTVFSLCARVGWWDVCTKFSN